MAGVSYGIGQHRFTESSKYVGSEVEKTGEYYGPPPGESGSEFSDLYLDFGSLDNGQDYHITCTIPLFADQERTVTVFLTDENNGKGNVTQFVKRYKLPKKKNSSRNEVTVAIHPQNIDGTGDTKIVKVDGTTCKIEENEGVRTLVDNGVSYSKFSYADLTETWKTSTEAEDTKFDVVFRPLLNDCRYVCLSLERTSDDYNKKEDGKTGYVIPTTGLECIVEPMKNLIGTADTYPIQHSSLVRIGVWGRPGLPMAINGEAINVGRSGYYELDTIPITSLAVYATNFDTDNFSIDYQYLNS